MDNMAVYKKTIGFSLRRLAWDILSVLILGALCIVGFLIADKAADNGIIGLLIGLVIGIVVLVILLRWVSYKYKAGQIAMMTRAVTEDSLPDNVIAEGRKVVKERFATVALYYAATRVIKGIFNQIGRAITKLGDRIGGDTGSTIGSAISSVVNIVVAYLCDCCLGWIFFRKEEKPVKATLQGAALFFKHGKTFIKNMGRVFGMDVYTTQAVEKHVCGVSGTSVTLESAASEGDLSAHLAGTSLTGSFVKGDLIKIGSDSYTVTEGVTGHFRYAGGQPHRLPGRRPAGVCVRIPAPHQSRRAGRGKLRHHVRRPLPARHQGL